jgi:AbrB family looped-hinge helix DNA binding protein
MSTIKLQQRGIFTLPKKIRESLNISDGDVFTVTQKNNQIILERAVSGDAELLREIQESLREIKTGKYIEFGSISEMKKKLATYDAD